MKEVLFISFISKHATKYLINNFNLQGNNKERIQKFLNISIGARLKINNVYRVHVL